MACGPKHAKKKIRQRRCVYTPKINFHPERTCLIIHWLSILSKSPKSWLCWLSTDYPYCPKVWILIMLIIHIVQKSEILITLIIHWLSISSKSPKSWLRWLSTDYPYRSKSLDYAYADWLSATRNQAPMVIDYPYRPKFLDYAHADWLSATRNQACMVIDYPYPEFS